MLLSFVFCSVNHPIDVSVCLDLGTVEIQFLSPHQSSFNTQFHNVLEEQLEYFQPKTFTDFTQAAVIGDWLIQIIADEPAMSQIEIHSLHQLSFRADPFKKSDELQLEEHDWINGCTTDV